MSSETGDRPRLLSAFLTHRDDASRAALIEAYLPYVRLTLERRSAHLPGQYIEEEDLFQAGTVGLIAAVDSFEPGHGTSFGSWAIAKIRFAVQEHLRQEDVLPKRLRAKLRQAERAIAAVEATARRKAEAWEVAAEAGLSLEETEALLGTSPMREHPSLDEVVYVGDGETETAKEQLPDPAPDPFALVLSREQGRLLAAAISELPEKLRDVVVAYYYDGLTLKAIGARYGVTEARASQLHQQALSVLREILSDAASAFVDEEAVPAPSGGEPGPPAPAAAGAGR